MSQLTGSESSMADTGLTGQHQYNLLEDDPEVAALLEGSEDVNKRAIVVSHTVQNLKKDKSELKSRLKDEQEINRKNAELIKELEKRIDELNKLVRGKEINVEKTELINEQKNTTYLYKQVCSCENLSEIHRSYTSLKKEFDEVEREFRVSRIEIEEQLKITVDSKFDLECMSSRVAELQQMCDQIEEERLSTVRNLNDLDEVAELQQMCDQIEEERLSTVRDLNDLDELSTESILKKSVIISNKKEQKTNVHPGAETFSSLVSVNSLWRHVIMGRRFNQRQLRRTMDYYAMPFRRWLPKPRPLKVINRNVCSLTKLNQRIYVICETQLLMVYDVKTLEFIYEQKLAFKVRPTDFAACVTNHCLYLSDRCAYCIWKFTVHRDNQNGPCSVDKWYNLSSAKNDDDRNQLIRSVTSINDGRVAVLICNVESWYGRTSQAARCDILTSNAVVQTSVDITYIRDQIVNPLCLSYTKRDTFFIIHHNGVSEVANVNGVGRVTKKFADSQLTMPVSFEVDNKFETMIVADRVSGKLFLMKQDLNAGLKKLLIDLRGEGQDENTAAASRRNFARVFYDCNEGQLIVGYTNGEIELYNVNTNK